MKCAFVYPKRKIPQHKRCQAPLADGTQCGSYKRHNKPTCANHAKFKVLRMRNKTKYFKKCYKNGTSRGRLMTEPCGAQCISDKKKGHQCMRMVSKHITGQAYCTEHVLKICYKNGTSRGAQCISDKKKGHQCMRMVTKNVTNQAYLAEVYHR